MWETSWEQGSLCSRENWELSAPSTLVPFSSPPSLVTHGRPTGRTAGAPLSTAVLSSLLAPGTGPCHSVALVNSDADLSDALLQVEIS